MEPADLRDATKEELEHEVVRLQLQLQLCGARQRLISCANTLAGQLQELYILRAENEALREEVVQLTLAPGERGAPSLHAG